MLRTTIRPRASAVALAAVLAATVTGCSAEEGADSATGGGDGITVQAAQFSWTAAGLTNSILSEIAAARPELGVATLQTTQLDPAAAWAGAQRGDIDLLTEVALPNQQELADSAAERVEIVSETYGDAAQGGSCPLTPSRRRPARGLTSVTQLNEYADQLGNKFYDADPDTSPPSRTPSGSRATGSRWSTSSPARRPSWRSWRTATAARSRSCCTCTTRTRSSRSTTWSSSRSPRPTARAA
jgi:glycine betaine/proline transport system substrate-binding protein